MLEDIGEEAMTEAIPIPNVRIKGSVSSLGLADIFMIGQRGRP